MPGPAVVHGFFDHIQGFAATFVAGGVGMRYLVLAVRALEPPDVCSGRFYRWFYRFIQSCLANPDLVEKAGGKPEKLGLAAGKIAGPPPATETRDLPI